jgi:hypothetical protein
MQGLHGDVYVTFEEGTWAAWLLDLLKSHVTEVVVCNPRKNALLQEGSKSDRIDAHAGRTVVHEQAQARLPPRTWPAPVKGIVPQIFEYQQGSRTGLVFVGGRSFITSNSTRCGPCTKTSQEGSVVRRTEAQRS